MRYRVNQIFLLSVLFVLLCVSADDAIWRWECDNGKCVKTRIDPRSTAPALSLEACKMFCNEYGLLWPRPTGKVDLGNFLCKVNLKNIELNILRKGASDDFMKAAAKRFKEKVLLAVPHGLTPKLTGKAVHISLVNNNPDVRALSLEMDESYSLQVSPSIANRMNATITANTFFGVRHGLETLSQLFVYDDIRDHLLMVRDVFITDIPMYPYRGILLDTARNYYSVKSIKRTIDAMATVKLNSFHWHITDSQSFPFVSTKRPNLHKFGAFNPKKVYTKEVIREVVRFGLERGLRVLPEFDAPAHVGEGWQHTNLTVCFKAGPWNNFCFEPPCGQLDPTKDELYEYLEDIYSDIAEAFDTDVFHMGGDEVSESCWNSSKSIQNFMLQKRWGLNKDSYLNLWKYFQQKAQNKAYKAFGMKLHLIIWSSTLTDHKHIENYINKEEYIIQIWTSDLDPQINGILEKGYRLIISNFDAFYFGCGFGQWLGAGNNDRSSIGWQKVYDNSPAAIALGYRNQVLGGEAALWSEQSDTSSLDNCLWPRAAALAERLWAEPTSTWKDAESRMLHIRERLVRMGVNADHIQPEWCYQNEGYCHKPD